MLQDVGSPFLTKYLFKSYLHSRLPCMFVNVVDVSNRGVVCLICQSKMAKGGVLTNESEINYNNVRFKM